jgi:hypothetical protein
MNLSEMALVLKLNILFCCESKLLFFMLDLSHCSTTSNGWSLG